MWAFVNRNYEISQWLQIVSRGFRIQRFRYGLPLEKNKTYYLPPKKPIKTESAKLPLFPLNISALIFYKTSLSSFCGCRDLFLFIIRR